jgi:O-acetyl-ADP-ribose deacetylase (regulator of RNase III)
MRDRERDAESLRLAEENGVRSVAFPTISVGKNGYPVAKAAQIAFRAAVEHLAERARSVELISFVLYSPTELMAFASALASNASTLPGRTRV